MTAFSVLLGRLLFPPKLLLVFDGPRVITCKQRRYTYKYTLGLYDTKQWIPLIGFAGLDRNHVEISV